MQRERGIAIREQNIPQLVTTASIQATSIQFSEPRNGNKELQLS